MGGLVLLVGLCVIMATASFLAGALPLSVTLTPSQMRFISSIGIGVLVGTSLIVIIPEGIEAVAILPTESSYIHRTRSLLRRSPPVFLKSSDIQHLSSTSTNPLEEEVDSLTSLMDGRVGGYKSSDVAQDLTSTGADLLEGKAILPVVEVRQSLSDKEKEEDDDGQEGTPAVGPSPSTDPENHAPHFEMPTFEIGFSMTLGFVLMFLIDRLPRHATESLRSGPETRHMSLDNLGSSASSVDEEADGFLSSLTPSPRRARSLATTVGLVIHAAADGVAMGASSTASDIRLGFVIFLAILLHKAPAAFGLTSVLLKQGLSKRAARGHLIIFSLAAPVGAITTWCLVTLLGGDHLEGHAGQWWTGMLLLFSGGTFLYVSMHAMQEESASPSHEHGMSLNGYSDVNIIQQRKPKGPRMRDTMATMAGILLPLLTQMGHQH